MEELITINNLKFLFDGLKMTLYISTVSILLSTFFGTILGVLRNNGKGIFKAFAAAYIEIVRNIPNLLWIYVIFVIVRLKSVDAGIVSFTIFTSAAIGEIVRGGLNSVGTGQIEAARSQGFNALQQLWYVILPQAMRRSVPTLVSQYTTVVKDSSFLWSVVAIQELTGKTTILMGRYFRIDQIFILYGILALIYFIINFGISAIFRRLQKRWVYLQ